MAYSAEQVKAYLARIGLSGELPLTAETLTRIVSAHYQTVPYENLLSFPEPLLTCLRKRFFRRSFWSIGEVSALS